MWVLERLDSEDGLTIDKVKQDVRQAITWAKDAWNEVTPSTIINCWNKIGIQPAIDLEIVVEENVMSELSSLLLHFAACTDIEACTAEELVNIPAERWTEDLDSDDDESDLAKAMAECPDPQGSEAVEDDSVEIKCMTLKDAQAASSALFHFLQENGSPLAKDASGIMKEVGKMVLTTGHHQATLQGWFTKPSAGPRGVGDGGLPP